MLTKVHVQNYRSCKNVLIEDMGSMVALVGRNGAGKTNILRAIQWAAEKSTSTKVIEYYDIWFDDHFHIVLEFVQNQNVYSYEISTSLVKAEEEGEAVAESRMDENESTPYRTALFEKLCIRDDSGNWASLLARDDEYINLAGVETPIKIGAGSASLPVIEAILPSEHTIEHIFPVIAYLRHIRYYALDEPNEPQGDPGFILYDEYADWLSKQKRHRDPASSVVFPILHMFQDRKREFEELRSLLGSDGLGIIQDILVAVVGAQSDDHSESSGGEAPGKSNTFYMLRFALAQGDPPRERRFGYTSLSLGTRRLLRILVAMIYDGSSVLLLEHPEDGIHAGLLNKLIPLLKTYTDPAQFIVTSHSSIVFDQLEAQDVRLVTMEDGETHVRALTSEETQLAQKFVQEEGSLSEFLETVQED